MTKLQNVDFRGAQLQRADFGLSYWFAGADEIGLVDSINIESSKNSGGALRSMNLRDASARTDRHTDFRNAFLDPSVILPEHFFKRQGKPCQWIVSDDPEDALDDAAFFGHWRGWIEHESNPYGVEWPYVAPEGWENVTPIPPPPGCAWKTGPWPNRPR